MDKTCGTCKWPCCCFRDCSGEFRDIDSCENKKSNKWGTTIKPTNTCLQWEAAMTNSIGGNDVSMALGTD